MGQADRTVMVAPHVRPPITLDGRLSEPVWKEAPSYQMELAASDIQAGREIEERGEVRLAWDDDFFHVGIRFEDSDIVAESEQDNIVHNGVGDVCELFLKPEDQSWYWELHVTPRGQKACFFLPGRGRLGLPSSIANECGLKVAAHCDGTLNDWRERDREWTAEMAMPIRDLTAHGGRFEPGAKWRIMVARYNYSRFLSTRGPELSTTPQLSVPDFHRFEEYATLELVR